ncbi:MAG: DNA polymerase III subunit delta [Acidobacteria bacterium]|nr:DNA polymerase III subunit delta [Acidobacteriota bacterium]
MRVLPDRALESIQKGSLASGYCLIGREIYWRDRIWQALREAVGWENGLAAVSEYDLREEALHKVLDEALTQNLLSPRQLILVRNAQWVASRPRRGVAEPAGEEKALAGVSPLSNYFRNPNPSTVLVLEMMDVNLESEERKEKDKVKSRLELFANLCDIVLLPAPELGEAMEIARQEAVRRGKTLSPEAAERLVVAMNRNMAQICRELDKLCLYRPEKKSLETDDLDPLMPALDRSREIGVAMGSGDAKTALEALASALESGRYAPLVIWEIARCLRQLILLKENRVADSRQAARVLWSARLPAPQDSVPALLRQARSIPEGFLLRGLQWAFEADLALRSSPPDERIILERLILKLTHRNPARRKPAG